MVLMVKKKYEQENPFCSSGNMYTEFLFVRLFTRKRRYFPKGADDRK